jgi:eukaryotic-like serine/threonine-protein kinase
VHLQPGQILADKYRIVRQIGHGGMGAVFEGENFRIHRRVAIKTLHAQVAGKADILQRFEREAQAAGRIGSEHIVEVLDMGDLPDGSRFMVMEFLSGCTLGDRIVQSGKVQARALAGPLAELLEGLGRAHAAGIIHRDLKPANVFLLDSKPGQPDFVKILDFGVSKFNVLNSDEMSMTRTGAVMGTPYYMSPEQAKGARAIEPRSDLYSVGVIMYEAVTGQVPFNADTFNELIFKIALDTPPPPESFVPNLDPAFGAILRKAMAREAEARFQSAEEMRSAVIAWAVDYDQRQQAQKMGPAAQLGGTVVMGPPPREGGGAGATVLGGGGPPRAASGTLAMTPAPFQPAAKKGMGLVIALGAAALLLVGGAILAYAQMAPKPSPTETVRPSSAPVSVQPPSSTQPQATSEVPAAASASSEPSAAIEAAPSASVSAGPTPTPARPTGFGTAPRSTATPARPTSSPTSKPTVTRPITPEL